MSAMKVDFNQLRLRACDECDSLAKALKPLEERKPEEGVLLSPDQIDRIVRRFNAMRGSVGSIAICYDEHGNKDVLGDRDLLWLNNVDEEE